MRLRNHRDTIWLSLCLMTLQVVFYPLPVPSANAMPTGDMKTNPLSITHDAKPEGRTRRETSKPKLLPEAEALRANHDQLGQTSDPKERLKRDTYDLPKLKSLNNHQRGQTAEGKARWKREIGPVVGRAIQLAAAAKMAVGSKLAFVARHVLKGKAALAEKLALAAKVTSRAKTALGRKLLTKPGSLPELDPEALWNDEKWNDYMSHEVSESATLLNSPGMALRTALAMKLGVGIKLANITGLALKRKAALAEKIASGARAVGRVKAVLALMHAFKPQLINLKPDAKIQQTVESDERWNQYISQLTCVIQRVKKLEAEGVAIKDITKADMTKCKVAKWRDEVQEKESEETNERKGKSLDPEQEALQQNNERIQTENELTSCAVVYEHEDFTGKYLTIPVGATWDDLDQHGWNDAASSVKVSPNCLFKGYRHDNMEDLIMNYSRDEEYVGDGSNDHLSSLSCHCSGQSNHIIPKPTCAVVYEHRDFTGKYLNVPVGTAWDDLHQHGWNDEASSIKVSPNCIFKGFKHSNMKEDLMTYSSDQSYVGVDNNDQLSSLICECNVEPEHKKLSRADPGISTTTTLPDTTTGSEEKVQPKVYQVLPALQEALLPERSSTTSSPLTDNPKAKSDPEESKVHPSPKQGTGDLNSDDDWMEDFHKDMEEFHKDMEEFHKDMEECHKEMAQWRKNFEAEMEDFWKDMEEMHGQY